MRALADLARRSNLPVPDMEDPAQVEQIWRRRRPLYEHLAAIADQFWIAEEAGEIVGYARSIIQDGVQELTEFFVLPERQGGGIGSQLLARALPDRGARRRSIIATLDGRAQPQYLRRGVYPRSTLQYLEREPELVDLESDLEFEAMSATPDTLADLGAIDRAVLGFRRDATHDFLLRDRKGFLYRRGGRPVGYGYTGKGTGPIAVMDEADVPAALAHAERLAAKAGDKVFGVELPLVNRAAVTYLLGRGFRLDPFVAVVMNDGPFVRLENYVLTSPPFFL
jgi:GNAT superfamily N-acetyltransferase